MMDGRERERERVLILRTKQFTGFVKIKEIGNGHNFQLLTLMCPDQQKINKKALVPAIASVALTWTRCNTILLIFSVDLVTIN